MNPLNTFSHWEDVPIFDSEEAEALFWSENRPDLRLMETAVSGSNEALESVTISLRIDPRMLARIKRLARARYLNYQSMIKQWLSERMEAEMTTETQNPNVKGQARGRSSAAFTLVELLVVITIIGIIAGLTVGLAGVAVKKSKISRVKAEMEKLSTAIKTYQSKKGYFPPDNPNNTLTNALYYELAGTVNNQQIYTTLDSQDTITNTTAIPTLSTYCGVGGLANSSTGSKDSDNFTAESFLSNFKSTEFLTTTNGVKLFKVSGDAPGTQPTFNTWHYVSSHPTNNPSGFDLWAEVMFGNKTNVICNWSDSVIVK
ncbi:MAG TPA: CopG family antitoxin [Dongiaceae bacterium]|jgi:prepilin-type N-terminal cleavage/methylation domain-containing protein|nr:CopG family antitoxin [Dongiaceae bacterium]